MSLTNRPSGRVTIGVDPGLSGAIAFYRQHDGMMKIYDMPTRAKGGTHATRKEIDPYELSFIVKKFALYADIAVIEDVGAMVYRDASGFKRGQGAAQSFAFGKAAGVVIGVIAAHGIRIQPVLPAVWKSLYGLSRDKDKSRVKATNMFPRNSDDFTRKKDADRAEAALLAYFAADRFSLDKTRGRE